MKSLSRLKKEKRHSIKSSLNKLSIFLIMFRIQVKGEEKKLAPGEKVSLEKITEIILRVAREARSLSESRSGTRNEKGEFNDFL